MSTDVSSRTREVFLTDLQKSGITKEELGAYLAGPVEATACKLKMYNDELTSPGYVIPYYDMKGERVPFYRVRLLSPREDGPKYLQPVDTATYIYFPPQFQQQLQLLNENKLPRAKLNGHDPYVLLCEGEKKAAKAAKEGFLAIALGGVYNWRSRTLSLPADIKLTRDTEKNVIHLRLPGSDAADDIEDAVISKWAVGFKELVDYLIRHLYHAIILFDTDYPENPKVQKAAATLAFELRSMGMSMSHIRQLRLPGKNAKVALDDFLLEHGPNVLEKVIHEVLDAKSAFPTFPNMKVYVNQMLSGKVARKQIKETATAILADLDVNGMRLSDANDGTPYYFDNKTRALMDVAMMHSSGTPLHETDFGRLLYNRYDISQGDSRLMPWLAAAFTGEQPIYKVRPFSVIAQIDTENIAYQVSDGQFVIISGNAKNPITVHNNGDKGILFKSGQVENLDPAEVIAQFTEQMKHPFEPWWLDIMKEFHFVRDSDRYLATLLFYISPWLLRWRGTQLPVELMVGEPGSGKSSMYMLRMAVLTGRPALRNQPADIRDWYASVTSVDGLHVTDNVHFVTKEIKQRLSDEICRLVTEPDPSFELRKLYTTSTNYRVPVRSVFALTAIQQPFTNADILQRAAIFDLSAIGGDHDNDWLGRHLRARGGRAAWVAHQLVALHLLLRRTAVDSPTAWDQNYRSKHRLVNYEQCLEHMSQISGISEIKPNQVTWFVRDVEEQVSEYDWTMEGLKEFAQYVSPILASAPDKYFTSQHVVDWMSSKEDYKDNQFLINARRLGRYFTSHATMIQKATGIYNIGVKKNNREAYRVRTTNKL